MKVLLVLSCNESPQPVSTSPVPQSQSSSSYDLLRAMMHADSMAAIRIADSIRAANPSSPATQKPPTANKGLTFHGHDELYPCQIENADTSIHGVILCDINSSVQMLGKQWELIEDNVDMPHQNYSNAHGSQFLTCFFHYGGGRYDYSEFQVSYSCKESKIKTLSDEEFVSGNGIRLGMNKDSVIAIIGNCYIVDTVTKNTSDTSPTITCTVNSSSIGITRSTMLTMNSGKINWCGSALDLSILDNSRTINYASAHRLSS